MLIDQLRLRPEAHFRLGKEKQVVCAVALLGGLLNSEKRLSIAGGGFPKVCNYSVILYISSLVFTSINQSTSEILMDAMTAIYSDNVCEADGRHSAICHGTDAVHKIACCTVM